jgi:tetratricopeptide (TPR) repeat protein
MHVIRKLKLDLLLFIIPVFFISGCYAGTRGQIMVDTMKPLMDKMKISVNKNSDVELIRDSMPVSLVQIDGLLELSPDDKDLLARAAEVNSGYAFLFVEEKDKARARRLYKKARDYALRALKQNEAFERALNQPNEDFVQALNTFEKEDVPALFFATSSWLSWIGLSHASDPEVLMDLPKIEAMMDRILVLDESFNYGGVHALLGAFFASRPLKFGGQPEEAKYHFNEAFEISESKYLVWHLLYAKFYAVQIQDRQLFVTTLEKIISAPENLLPEINFVNEATRQKAKVLLAKVDDFF